MTTSNPKDNTMTDQLTHATGCSQERQLDMTPHDNGIVTHHCVECGAHAAFRDGQRLPEPTAVGPTATHNPYTETATMEATR